MSFNANNFRLITTSSGADGTGIPGIFSYNSATDNLATIVTNGYFPSSALFSAVVDGDFLIVKGSNGILLMVFSVPNSTTFNVISPPAMTIINTITGSSGNLNAGQTYFLNNALLGTYNLPDATLNIGRKITLKKIGGLASTISGTSGQTIDGAATLVMTSLNSHNVLISDGANWFIIS